MSTYFVSADDSVRSVVDGAYAEIVAGIVGAEDADLNSKDCDIENRPSCTTAELSSAFSVICCCCGTMEGASFSHLDTISELEESLDAEEEISKNQTFSC